MSKPKKPLIVEKAIKKGQLMREIPLYESTHNAVDTWIWRLKRARLTQDEVANVLGITRNHCGRILNKKVDPRLSQFIAIEKLLADKEKDVG